MLKDVFISILNSTHFPKDKPFLCARLLFVKLCITTPILILEVHLGQDEATGVKLEPLELQTHTGLQTDLSSFNPLTAMEKWPFAWMQLE